MKLIIDIKVTNLERATHFYESILGFKCRIKKENWSAILVGDSEIHLYTDGGTTRHVEFYVEDIDREVKRLSDDGVEFISGINKPNAIEVDILKITKFPWGRTAFFKDSEGNELAIVKDFDTDIISRIKALNLPVGKYIVFGSSVLEVHGIRKAKDVDLIVDKDVYNELKRRGWKRHWFVKRVLTCKALKKDGNEAFSHIKWKNYRVENDELFKNAEIIDGVPFMEINEYLRYKKCLPREKDKRDVKLIEAYLASRKVGM